MSQNEAFSNSQDKKKTSEHICNISEISHNEFFIMVTHTNDSLFSKFIKHREENPA